MAMFSDIRAHVVHGGNLNFHQQQTKINQGKYCLISKYIHSTSFPNMLYLQVFFKKTKNFKLNKSILHT